MNNSPLHVYVSRLDTPVIAPQVSRFYHLEPIGRGTALTEGVTGYIIRHAGEFEVPVQVLFRKEIGPLLGRKMLEHSSAASSFMRTAGHTFNGRDDLARDIIWAMAHLTGRCDLRFSTMLPWGAVLSHVELVRKIRAWCAVCWHEWREADQPMYEPLLWSVNSVSICPLHHRYLQTRCPYPDCGKQSPALAPNARPGHCPACRRWLGQPLNVIPMDTATSEATKAFHSWATHAVGDLIAIAPSLDAWPRREQVADIMSAYVDIAGNVHRLALVTGIQDAVIKRWQTGQMLPMLSHLLHFCHNVGTTPNDLLTADPRRFTPQLPNVNAQPVVVRAQRKQRAPLDLEALRLTLDQILASEEEAPSVVEVTKRLGLGRTTLTPHFSDLIAAIAARHQVYRKAKKAERIKVSTAEVRRVVTDLYQRGISPTAARVAAEVRLPMNFMEPEIEQAWRTALLELGLVRHSHGMGTES